MAENSQKTVNCKQKPMTGPGGQQYNTEARGTEKCKNSSLVIFVLFVLLEFDRRKYGSFVVCQNLKLPNDFKEEFQTMINGTSIQTQKSAGKQRASRQTACFLEESGYC